MISPRRAAVLLAGLTLLAYVGAARAAFVWDDRPVILNNARVTQPQPWWTYWTDPVLIAGQDLRGFRPLTLASFALNYRVAGPNRAVFHLTSVVIHAWAAVGLYVLVLQVGRWRDPTPRAWPEAALLVAGLFAVHPALSQAVLFLTARSTLIAGAGVLWAAVAYNAAVGRLGDDGAVGWPAYACALVAWLIALSGKESALAGAALFVGIEWWAVVRHAPRCRIGGALLRLGLFALVGLAYLYWVFGVVRAQETTPPARDLASNLMGQAAALTEYMRLLVWPTGLALDHGAEHLAEAWSVQAVLGIAITAGFAALAWRYRTAWPPVPFGILSAGILIGPESYAVPLKILINEHRLYLPAAGLCLAGVGPVAGIIQRRPRVSRTIACVVLALATVATMQRTAAWRSPQALWADAWARYPSSCRAPAHLGQLALEEGHPDAAIPYLESAVACNPWRLEPRNLLVTAYGQVGRFEEALAEGRKLVRDFPENSSVRSTLGTAYARSGDIQTAVRLWREALELDPANSVARDNLALAGEANF